MGFLDSFLKKQVQNLLHVMVWLAQGSMLDVTLLWVIPQKRK